MSRQPKFTESEVQSLKAQEAKDYCIELMQQLAAREGGPISPGEVQLQELQYELALKEAEVEDNRLREAHETRLKELELEIERERAEHARAAKRADEQRATYAQVIEQVAQSQEKLSVALDRATREHNVKTQMMQAEHQSQRDALNAEMQQLHSQRESLINEIDRLAELNSAAADVDSLRSLIEERKIATTREQKQLDEEIESMNFEKAKALKQIRREQEMEIAEIQADHRKLLLDANKETLDAMLTSLGFAKLKPEELEQLRKQASEQAALRDDEIAQIREQAIAELKRQFNVVSGDPIDVTDLFYREKALQEDNAFLQKQVQKLEAEVARMRTHIESESARVATAIEAARTNIQNNIEPGVKR